MTSLQRLIQLLHIDLCLWPCLHLVFFGVLSEGIDDGGASILGVIIGLVEVWVVPETAHKGIVLAFSDSFLPPIVLKDAVNYFLWYS